MENLQSEDLFEEYFVDMYDLIHIPVGFNEFIEGLKEKCIKNKIQFTIKNIVENDINGSINLFKQHQ